MSGRLLYLHNSHRSTNPLMAKLRPRTGHPHPAPGEKREYWTLFCIVRSYFSAIKLISRDENRPRGADTPARRGAAIESA